MKCDMIGQLQGQLVDVLAFIEDFAEDVISLIYFEQTAASEKLIKMNPSLSPPGDVMGPTLLVPHSLILSISPPQGT